MGQLCMWDQRMLNVMEYCISNQVNGITTQKAWCEAIGFEPTNINNIKKGVRGFSKEHLSNAGDVLGVDMNYLFGLTDIMFRKTATISPIDMLKQAVKAVEQDYQAIKPTVKPQTKPQTKTRKKK